MPVPGRRGASATNCRSLPRWPKAAGASETAGSDSEAAPGSGKADLADLAEDSASGWADIEARSGAAEKSKVWRFVSLWGLGQARASFRGCGPCARTSNQPGRRSGGRGCQSSFCSATRCDSEGYGSLGKARSARGALPELGSR